MHWGHLMLTLSSRKSSTSEVPRPAPIEAPLVLPTATDQAWSQGKRGKSQISKSILAFYWHNTLDGPQDPSVCARSQVYWNQGNNFHGLEEYHKSCGSHSLFLNKRFCLGKIYDSNLHSDANTSELLHVCKALFTDMRIWTEEPQNVLSKTAKNPKQTIGQASEWVPRDLYSLKTWTHSLASKRQGGFQGTRAFTTLPAVGIGHFEDMWRKDE